MFKKYVERVEDAGVVGAGGAGFPTHIKLNCKADVVIANGTECEPLLRVDQQLMETYPEKIIEGLRIAMKITSSARGVICLKEKYHKAQEILKAALVSNTKITLHLVGNYYPAGDEQQLVYEITGKVVPLGGIPIDVGAVVCNVATLMNIADSAENIPVTSKFVTVGGAVKNPVTLNVPIGTPIKSLIEKAGGPEKGQGYSLILGGPVMGKVEEDWMTPVTKTLGGIIVLPAEHSLISKKNSSLEKDARLAKSLCCQCNYCTQLCPRNTLGLGVEPHKVMRAIGFGGASSIGSPETVFGCCDCGLCTYYACNMGLSPGRMVSLIKNGLIKTGAKPKKYVPNEVSDGREYRKVPVNRFLERLNLGQFDLKAPINTDVLDTKAVKILLKQHIGMQAVPVIAKGDMVQKGDLIGRVEKGKLGANIHASITGAVVRISEEAIEIAAI